LEDIWLENEQLKKLVQEKQLEKQLKEQLEKQLKEQLEKLVQEKQLVELLEELQLAVSKRWLFFFSYRARVI